MTTGTEVMQAVSAGLALLSGLLGMPVVFGTVSDDKTREGLRSLLEEAYQLLGNKKFDEAKRNFENMLKIDPEHTGALVGLARLASMRGNPDEAIRRYNEALIFDPKNIDSLEELREVHLSKNSLGMESRPGYATAVKPLIDAFGEDGEKSQRWRQLLERWSYLHRKISQTEPPKAPPKPGSRGSVTIIHSSAPPAKGGVNTVIWEHAKELKKNGYRVKIIGGYPLEVNGTEREGISFHINQLIIGQAGADVTESLYADLRRQLEDVDVVIIHNIMTIPPFDSPVNIVLRRLIEEWKGKKKFVYVAHNVDYSAPPAIPGVEYLTVSEWYKHRDVDRILRTDTRVVSCGIDPRIDLNLTKEAIDFATKEKLLDQDLVMVYPTRLDWNKGVETAIWIAAELKRLNPNMKFKLIIATGLADENFKRKYEGYQNWGNDLGLKDNVIFYNTDTILDIETQRKFIANLYELSDVLLYPSDWESFGLQLLEAAVAGLPIAASERIGPRADLLGDNVYVFDPGNPAGAALGILYYLSGDLTAKRDMVYNRAGDFYWANIIRKDLLPLFSLPHSGTWTGMLFLPLPLDRLSDAMVRITEKIRKACVSVLAKETKGENKGS